jgi:hypothetical protein
MDGHAIMLIGAAVLIGFLLMPSRQPGRFGLLVGEAGLMSLSFLFALALAFDRVPGVTG